MHSTLTGDFRRSVTIRSDAMDGIISYCMMKHPEEAILIVRGRSRKGHIVVDGLVVPPFDTPQTAFGGFEHSFLPLDPTYVGILRSHPKGERTPSDAELNGFFGLVLLIMSHPYQEQDITAWDSSGNTIEMVDDTP